MERRIVHFDLDTFFVSVERLENTKLIGQPVVVGGTGDRGVVASCSYEARSMGIYSGMAMKIARRVCPQVQVVRGNSGKYSKYSSIITEIIKEKMPLVEKASVDEFYVDMTGMDAHFGIEMYSKDVRKYIIKHTGLPLSMGLSDNKTVSKVATGVAKPNGIRVIEHGDERHFLAPLSISKLPSIGPKTYDILRELGVEKIRTLQQMSAMEMEAVLGKNGVTIWQRAQGIDTSPIIPYHEKKSIGISRTFGVDTSDMVYLLSIIKAMATVLSFELRRGNRVCACVNVTIRYSDFKDAVHQRTIPYTSFENTITGMALRIFKEVYTRSVTLRLVGVSLSKLVMGNYQMNLLEDNEKLIRLLQAKDFLKNKYNNGMIVTTPDIMEHTNLDVMGDLWNGEPITPPAHRHL